MGRTILATLLALASIPAGIVASPAPQPVERSSVAANDTFQLTEGSGFHLVQCSPLASSAEQSWLSLVLVCRPNGYPLVKITYAYKEVLSTAKTTPTAVT